MTEWQPIETAPKGVTPLLLYGSWIDDGEHFSYTDIGWWQGGKWNLHMFSSPPTHWMTLPKPPVKKHNCKTTGSRVYRDNDGTLRWCSEYRSEVINFCPYCGEKA